MNYGILKSIVNTGLDSEILLRFIAPLSIINKAPSYAQDSLNLRRIVGSQNVQRWEIETRLDPKNTGSDFLVHSAVCGHHTNLYARMPQIYGNTLSSGVITVNGNLNANEDTFSINGATNLNVGEFIQFTGHKKVYLVIDGGSASTGIKIFPKLLTAITDLTPLILGGNVTLHGYYDTDVKLGITYIDGILADPGSIKIIEDI